MVLGLSVMVLGGSLFRRCWIFVFCCCFYVLNGFVMYVLKLGFLVFGIRSDEIFVECLVFRMFLYG